MSATVAGPAQASVFQQASQLHHEQVSFCHDADTGLRAIIGIHSTVLGPALGGLRFWNYASEADAVFDVMRLSRGMTFKAALAGLNLARETNVPTQEAAIRQAVNRIQSVGSLKKYW